MANSNGLPPQNEIAAVQGLEGVFLEDIQNNHLHGNGNPITITNGTSTSGHTHKVEDISADSDDESALRRAGVEINLQTLGTPEGGVAPLTLVSEFVSCCIREEYTAAIILCQKILEFEPTNQTAKEFYPVLQERLKLDDELSTESSSSSDDDDDVDDDVDDEGCVADPGPDSKAI